ncbi:hypothetical protein EUGRSUZ_A00024 [Eucalyptus grandis]|uniref:Uncharacterized protein n=2 Tax=Eucalyptus grandis TaxID=71139 RepID=A0ACC3LYS2_EUCGR|nr:hypothetical protein EUGRSUZ_A00024 [Eucalyptus grandis]
MPASFKTQVNQKHFSFPMKLSISIKLEHSIRAILSSVKQLEKDWRFNYARTVFSASELLVCWPSAKARQSIAE